MDDKEKRSGGFELRVSADDEEGVAYLRLPTHPGKGGKVSKSIRLVDVIGQYKGPDVVLDFDQDEVLVGIEILA
ncbi:DUF2283 domain-containing protein [Corallococcus carmarthensis]|uniref:DUF2283 domain-containing protein n=1 Tax=Corallococcus carmarthensis TaxID=2316728 RepID=UPI00148E386A|nr:DUF2283 domain-containing protein [Corallococcus carmarthensis]NOK18872.1 DUF2283 domain-containing protein [Corallococcus carmarthensis]